MIPKAARWNPSKIILLVGRSLHYYSPSADVNTSASAQLTVANPPFELSNPSSLELKLRSLSTAWFIQAVDLLRSWVSVPAHNLYMSRQEENVSLDLHYTINYGEGMNIRVVTIGNKSAMPVSLDNVHIHGASTNRTLLPSEVETYGGLFHMPVTVDVNDSDAIPLVGSEQAVDEILPITATAYLIIDGDVVPVSWRISTLTGTVYQNE